MLGDSVNVVVDIRWWLIPLGMGREISGVWYGSFESHDARDVIDCTSRMCG